MLIPFGISRLVSYCCDRSTIKTQLSMVSSLNSVIHLYIGIYIEIPIYSLKIARMLASQKDDSKIVFTFRNYRPHPPPRGLALGEGLDARKRERAKKD